MPLPLSLIPEFLPTPKRSQRSVQGADAIAEPLADTALEVEVSPVVMNILPDPVAEPPTPAPPKAEAEPSTPAPPKPEAEPPTPAPPKAEVEPSTPAPPKPEAEPSTPAPPEPEAEAAADDDGEHLTVVLSATELERTKTLRELRQMCEEAKKPSTGKKAELARRLTSE